MTEATAGLFPGQGVDSKSVLAALAEGDPYLEIAEGLLGEPLRKPIEAHARRRGSKVPTSLAQPAIFVASCIAWRRSLDTGRSFRCLAGHSLGEYAALVAGGSFSFEDGLAVVAARAAAMNAAARAAPGGMAAVIGLEREQLDELAAAAGVVVANDNAPGQLVLSGAEEALGDAGRRVTQLGGRAVLLEVSGAFHSPAMRPAEPALRDALDHVSIRTPRIPVVSNLSAAPYRAPGEIRALLVRQVSEPIRWRQSLEWLWAHGARSFEDLGPGRVVGRLAEKTFSDRKVLLDA
ncbi:MAG: ACP S-malonyltransferase [Actinomycetota bacterium]